MSYQLVNHRGFNILMFQPGVEGVAKDAKYLLVALFAVLNFVPSGNLPVSGNKKALEFQGLCLICGGDAGT
jgi:hypothetical protein